MAELATLARPYAKAVFAAAKGADELDRWSRMLAFMAAASLDSRMKVLLDAPEVAEERKAHELISVCADELNDRAKNFIHVLAQNKRLDLLEEIGELYEQLRAQEQQSLDVKIVSAFPLSDDQAEKLRNALHRRFEKEIRLTSEVDQALIGGAIVRAGDMVIDGSVRGKLNKLSEAIQRR